MGTVRDSFGENIGSTEMGKTDSKALDVHVANDIGTTIASSDTNEIDTVINSVSTTAVEIELPEGELVSIFHQTENGNIHFSSSSSVSTSDPVMEYGDILKIACRKDFLLYMVSANGTVPVYAMTVIKA